MSDGGVADLVVVGLGPAGRALTHRAHAAGLAVVAVDPAPDRAWTPTYAMWADELPAWLDRRVVAADVAGPRVVAVREHVVEREYVVLDNAIFRAALDTGSARVVTGRALHLDGSAVTLGDGTVLRARHLVDARGLRAGGGAAEQTAYGIVLPAAAAAPALGHAPALFMDWRRDNGTTTDDPPSFLYAVPVGNGRTLLEETCLVGRPALPVSVLRERLLTRLSHRGVDVPTDAEVEKVRFPVEAPRPGGGALAFGSRGALTHPGTGYSVAASLGAVDDLVGALVAGDDPGKALWPRPARTVRALREVGLRALLALPAPLVPEFFDDFFALPPQLQRAYLSRRTEPRATASAMWTLFRHASMPVRRTLVGAALPRHH
ncbi:lycopene cyclase family protein [Rhodococcus sp. Q]|uniref:lycopene cyclase family protein n=1 Tax=Rhodococcus sp. Q TaxID=2502252 RepID=UPI0010F4FF58|nr:lycopene cyclase family protein [Rhodococcus sp. Q]